MQLHSETSSLPLRAKIALVFVRKIYPVATRKDEAVRYTNVLKFRTPRSSSLCRNLKLSGTMKREIMLKSESRGYEGCAQAGEPGRRGVPR